MTRPRRYVLEQLVTGNRARPYGRGWVLMGWPYSLIPARTWGPLQDAGYVDDSGNITNVGREVIGESPR
jgi:hypothetical protein